MQDYKNITWKYLSILFILFALIAGGRLFFDNLHYKSMLEDKTSFLAKDLQEKLISTEKSLKDKFSMMAIHLMGTEHVSKLFAENKREELYSFLKEHYKEFKHIEPNLHVMHFFNANNITVLRMHKPNSYNDDLTIKRPIVAYANKSLKQQNAFEVGKNGIVYRVTTPYIHNSKHIGVLELGIKLKYFVNAISQQYEVESEILVKDKLLNTLLAKKRYKKLDGYSIVSQSDLFKSLSTKIDLTKDRQIIESDNKYYVVFTNLNLNDYQDEAVAKILIAKDITAYMTKNKSSMLLINSITVVILLFIFLLLYIIFTKYVKEINDNIKRMNKFKAKSVYFENRANRDNLTKAFNKEYLNKYLEEFLKINRNGVVLFFDIDNFKNCNDVHGHLIGDEILTQLSQTIQDYLRTDDLFVRWGGEEFIILFEDISFDIAVRKAESIRLLIEKTKFTNDIPITISIGVTKIKDNDSMTSLLNRADNLLYHAKESGRNKVISDI